jgi:hypothetical protein
MRKMTLALSALLLVGALIGVPLLHAQGYSFNTASSWAAVALSKSATMTATTSTVKRLIASQFTLTPTGGTLTMSPTTDSLAAMRGAITLTSGDTLAAGFLYGVQGKLTLDGTTIAVGSGHIAGVYGQISGNGMTATSGHIAVIIASGQNLPTSANVDMLYAESGGGTVNSVLKAYVKSTYFFDISGEANFAHSTVATGAGQCGQNGLAATKALAVKVDNTAYFIPLCTAL